MDELLKILEIIMPGITLLLSYFISRRTAKYEAKRLMLEKEESRKSKVDSLLLKLLSLSQQYCEHHFGATKTECLDTAVALLQIAPEKFVPLIMEMRTAVETQNYKRITELRKEILEIYLNAYKNTNKNTV